MRESAMLLGAMMALFISEPVKADVQVQCQMGSSCGYQRVLSRMVVMNGDGVTVINARIRSCVKDFGPFSERAGRHPVPPYYSCQLFDDLNTEYVVAACSKNAPFIGGYDTKDEKWHLRQVVQGTKHVVPDLVTYFMICHEYDGKGDLLTVAKKLGYNIPEQAEWQEHKPDNINETGQVELVAESLDDLVKKFVESTQRSVEANKKYTRNAPLEHKFGPFDTCLPEQVSNEFDPDPIIRVDVVVDEHVGFTVAHHSKRGVTYVRSEQYVITKFWAGNSHEMPPKVAATWEGWLRKNPNTIMNGKLELIFQTRNGEKILRWHYTEYTAERRSHGAVDNPQLVSSCWADWSD